MDESHPDGGSPEPAAVADLGAPVEVVARPATSRGMRTRRRVGVRARRLLRDAGAVGAVPVTTVLIGAELVRALRVRRHVVQLGDEPGSAFRRDPAMPVRRADRSVADVVGRIRRFPSRPLRIPPRLAFSREYASDGVSVLLGAESTLGRLFSAYPQPFRQRLLRGADGEHLAGLVAMHPGAAPALVVCHGLLNSKHVHYVRQIATRAHEEWGFHVAVVDLRSFGQSAWTSRAPSGLGDAEGRDVVEIARDLRADPLVTSVGVLGYSLGGATALNAARAATEDGGGLLDGGVLSVCAPTDVRAAADRLSRRPPLLSPLFPVWALFGAGSSAGLRRAGHGVLGDWSLHEAIERISAPFYEQPAGELYDAASAVRWIDQVRVPTLALHARDDFVIPVRHVERLAEAATDNEHVGVVVTERGNHCAYPGVDPRWFSSVVRCWFEYWAREADALD